MSLGLIPQFDNTAALRYFYEVARCGSLRRAADKIHIAASAISRQILLLEDELGVRLFDRGRKGVRLTPAGEALVYRVRRAMNELGAARSEIDALHGQHRGSISIGVNETVGREFMAAFLVEFHSAYPEIALNVTIGNTAALVDLVLRGDIEIMVGYNVPAHAGLDRIASFELETCVMVQVGHRLAKRRSVQVADLVNDKLIMPDNTLSLRQVLDSMFVHASTKPSAILSTNSFEMMANLVVAGMGIGMQVRLHAGKDNIRPEIVYVPIRDPKIRPVALACCVRAGQVPNIPLSICTQRMGSALQVWSRNGAPEACAQVA
jgi:DNA-binding transcriptional LysR family regulator